jgi:hypothetical protein
MKIDIANICLENTANQYYKPLSYFDITLQKHRQTPSAKSVWLSTLAPKVVILFLFSPLWKQLDEPQLHPIHSIPINNSNNVKKSHHLLHICLIFLNCNSKFIITKLVFGWLHLVKCGLYCQCFGDSYCPHFLSISICSHHPQWVQYYDRCMFDKYKHLYMLVKYQHKIKYKHFTGK